MDKQLYIAHGYTADSKKHWFKWLTEQFEDIDSKILDFPNSSKPVLEDWNKTLLDEVDISSGNNVIVAHSLGVVTVLDYLSRYEGEWNVKGLVLVAGFYEKIPNLNKIDTYMDQTQVDFEKIIKQVPNSVSVIASHDRLVPRHLSERLAERLQSEEVIIQHVGHFCDSDGYTEFPEVAEIVNDMFNK